MSDHRSVVITVAVVGAGSLACGGSVDGDTTKGFHERGSAGKEVYYTLNTPSGSARNLYQFALSNVKRLTGTSSPQYVTIYDSSWKMAANMASMHIETTLEAGKTYYVLVDSSSSGGAGTFTLTASCTAPGTSKQGMCVAS